MVSTYLISVEIDLHWGKNVNPIKFTVDGELYRFHKENYNIIIQHWEPHRKRKRDRWWRVSGYHNTLTIQRELAEYFAPKEAATIEDYYKQLIATLADISMQLGALIDNE